MPIQPTDRPLEAALASHDNGFNLVRLACALLVVCYHGWQMNLVAPGPDPLTRMLAPVTDLGALAVGVFFALSGMFVARSWMADPHPGRFAVRRIARIVPGLFACLLLSTTLAVGIGSAAGWRGMLEAAPWRFILGNTTLHGLAYAIPPQELRLPGVLGGQDLNGPLWTLYWEGRMYVMVALLGMAAALPLRQWLGGCALFLLAAAALFPEVVGGYVWEVRMWSLFLVGMLLQTLAPGLRIGWAQVACAAALLLLNWTRNAALTASPLSWFGVALLALTLALCVGSRRPRLAGHLQRHDYSYGVYIWHWPVIILLRDAWPALGPVALTLATLALVLPLAAASWHLVEAPALAAARRWLAKRRPAMLAPAA